MYTYYSLRRPIGPGTCPNGFAEFQNFDYRQTMKSGIRAWGTVTYSEPLSPEDVDDYELAAVPAGDLTE